jgi:Cu(I)/Ag(I) efflux system membrane fusion protein
MPDKVFRGTVKSVAGMTSQSFVFDSTAGGTFDATVTVPNLDSHLRPGLTADLRFDGATQKDVLFVPRIAILVKEGKHIVYVQTGSGYRQHEVKVLNENESSSAIAGIAEGTLVALRDPAAPVRTPASAAGASGGIL